MKYLVFLIFIFCCACSSDSSKLNVKTDSEIKNVERVPSQASDEVSMETLINDSWVVEIVLANGQINEQDSWKDSKLEFKADGSYTWAGATEISAGKFSLDLERNIVLLASPDSTKNSEWSIKSKQNIMVWVGTPKFGHHSIQMKLVKNREGAN